MKRLNIININFFYFNFLGLEWSPDISAVTFMAAASSSPEMFVNILATFLTKSDVGVGTVLGSGLFAMLLVPAFCIIFSSSKVKKKIK